MGLFGRERCDIILSLLFFSLCLLFFFFSATCRLKVGQRCSEPFMCSSLSRANVDQCNSSTWRCHSVVKPSAMIPPTTQARVRRVGRAGDQQGTGRTHEILMCDIVGEGDGDEPVLVGIVLLRWRHNHACRPYQQSVVMGQRVGVGWEAKIGVEGSAKSGKLAGGAGLRPFEDSRPSGVVGAQDPAASRAPDLPREIANQPLCAVLCDT